MILFILSCTVFAALRGAAYAASQERADDEPFLPGLVAMYRDEHGASATRVDHQLSFHWGDLSPDPRLGEGPFHATWQGLLNVDAAGEYRFILYGHGEVELKIGGKAAVPRQIIRDGRCESPSLKLAAELTPVELSFRRTEKDSQLLVLWSSRHFGREPIPPRFLFHPRERTVGRDFERGHLLARALRCDSCHSGKSTAAPDLSRLAGNLSRVWLVEWLASQQQADKRPDNAEPVSPRRMPSFGLTADQAAAIADWLLTPHTGVQAEPAAASPEKPQRKKTRPDAKTGERLFVTLGCLACHTWRDLGASGWFGGGDLTRVGEKRPPAFLATWLAEPARLNREHRMPVFSLSDEERTSLALFLAEQKTKQASGPAADRDSRERRAEGHKLVEQFRCATCHRLPQQASAKPQASVSGLPALNAQSRWEHGCLGKAEPAKHRPGYQLDDGDASAVRLFYSQRQPDRNGTTVRFDGALALVEHNCLACHAREGTREAWPLLPPLLADKLTAVAGRYSELASLVPALTPPALGSAGDKLTDQALTDAVARRGEPHRSYLQVRMPRFTLADAEQKALVQSLIAADRVPDNEQPRAAESRQADRYTIAGGRLVSSDGFGCTSCHAVGSVQPPPGPLSARGPNLSLLERRIRRGWFDRFVRNPARLIPRMEMPAVQIPVPGVLDQRLDEQLAAVWQVLNISGFEPPPPNPIRIARHLGNDLGASPILITDVLQDRSRLRIKPFLIGLANRHNVLLDLETAALTSWTAGDVARQQTKGKSWFWEPGGAPVLETGLSGPDVSLVREGHAVAYRPLGQFIAEVDGWEFAGNALKLRYRLAFADKTMLHLERAWRPLNGSGFAQELTIEGISVGAQVRLDLLSANIAARAKVVDGGRAIEIGDRFHSRITLHEPTGTHFSADAAAVILGRDATGTAGAVLHYNSDVPVDRFPKPPQLAVSEKAVPVEIGPGFTAERLPLPPIFMPTGLSWRPNGKLVFCSLKGQVFEAIDTDGDGSEDGLSVLADGLPAPYGIYAADDYVDVSAKYALLRIRDSGRRVDAIASGWGYSRDYHDWACGLPRNVKGEYFLGIPCQQDKRSPEAARFHGNVLRLSPRKPTPDDPRLFTLAPISAGHRFPTGLALDRAGELFVTDNQGNYKPFNELNHVRAGAHFGFINTLDRGKPAPPRTPSAIEIPHPWTRSVNGICFLYTPPEVRARLGRDAFGPLEGHLIGCEYTSRQLVRMTLERVGDTFQGAAYPLSIPPSDPARGLVGPIVCGVSPRGDLYVGNLQESGWGAGNNTGDLVRVRFDADKLPCGIAEVRALRDGFTLDFFRAVDRARAERSDSYVIQSYRREPTPAYGGPDRDRRTERVTRIDVAPDGRRVNVHFAEMRPGFVYEFRLKNLSPDRAAFFPAEAHYTLRVVP